MKLLLLMLIVPCVLSNVIPQNTNEDLVFVIAIYRHGDRTPIRTYPADQYQGEAYWPEGAGQLTDIGKRQQFELGRWLRQRYDRFLPNKYSNKDIYVRCTDVDRTLMSAATNLAALYEPGDNNWSETIRWQPIPIHTLPEISDYVVAAKKPCPKYKKLSQDLETSEFFRRFYELHKEDFEYLSKNMGKNVSLLDDDVKDTQDALFIQNLRNMTLPEWTKRVFPDLLLSFVNLWIQKPCFTQEMARLKIGPLLIEILNHFDAKLNGKITQKFWMYSAHDTTLANLMKGLNMFDSPHIPPYCSALLFELHSKNGASYVEIHYRNSTTAEPHLLKLPGCETKCPLKKMKELLQPLLPENWEEECKL